MVYLIEVNPRASRTVPFVAKAIGTPIAKIAARVMAGEKLADFPPIHRDIAHIAVKEAVFPFARFPGIDPVLSPEMKSTGEVMGIAAIFRQPSSSPSTGPGSICPTEAAPCSSRSRTATSRPIVPAGAGADRPRLQRRSRPAAPPIISQAEGLPSSGSTRWRRAARISSTGSRTAAIDIVFNTTEGWQSHKDSASIRASALDARRFPTSPPPPRAVAVARAIAALSGAWP